MEMRNITLSMPKDTLIKVKIVAAKRQTSVSGLLQDALARIVQEDAAYETANSKHLALLSRATSLGTGGSAGWRKEDLHARQ